MCYTATIKVPMRVLYGCHNNVIRVLYGCYANRIRLSYRCCKNDIRMPRHVSKGYNLRSRGNLRVLGKGYAKGVQILLRRFSET